MYLYSRELKKIGTFYIEDIRKSIYRYVLRSLKNVCTLLLSYSNLNSIRRYLGEDFHCTACFIIEKKERSDTLNTGGVPLAQDHVG